MDKEFSGSANCLGPGVQVGEYRLNDVVGEGGFGIVYKARDLSLDRIVAIKEYMPATLAGRKDGNEVHVRSQHRGAFDAGLRSFINEARLLAKFSHPALVHVYRFFEANGTAYMVMQYYEGQTFRSFLAQQHTVDEAWLSAVLVPILDVLEMLHAADCYHRDIAPDNIFLQESGMPVLLDFGAARRIIGDMTQALTMVLKPGFAPIEQYVDDGAMPQGAWTDIYQLGAVLYQAITGRPPATSVARMINDPLARLTPENCPGFSARFLHGVQSALAVKPQDRPQGIAELRQLLGLKTVTISWPHASAAAAGAEVAVRASEPVPEASATSPALRPVEAVASMIPSHLAPAGAHGAGAERRVAEDDAFLQPTQPMPLQDIPPSRMEPSAAAVASEMHGDGGHRGEKPASRAAAASSAGARAAAPAVAASVPVPSKSGRPAWLVPLLAVLALLLVGGVWWTVQASSEAAARERMAVQEASQWELASRINTVESVQAYLSAFPNGAHRMQAEEALTQLTARSLQATAVPAAQDAAASAPAVVASAALPPAEPASRASAPAAAALPAASAAHAGPAPAASVPAAENSARSPRTAGREAENTGRVILRVMPWGNVTVDRVPVGTTPPLTQLTLSEGFHRIELSNPASQTVTRMVQVRRGESVVLTHKFE
ncbi:serine/threonine protein kinase [Paracidovorax citrulli]|uniref:non-specific serine/threonine protein kinase n=1 Tax=Paracidovorax citrulli (strain AAC00-1) TaxID=397945 RepID=A1TM69_PARC0|nr:serine/threonine-protein kinase [Paracidovorax citrulli]ABM32057.1 serine/threonine protein kinase [Paracidovorax citrulli AAC00-1]PVY66246.1 serine/threonine protein kinase [Paracidovorax citrulli]